MTDQADDKNFRVWLAALYELTIRRGNPGLVDLTQPDTYREYFDDRDSPGAAYRMLLESAVREANRAKGRDTHVH